MDALFDRPAVLIVLIILVILLFGAKRLPDLSRSVGRSLRIFKAETEGLRGDHDDAEGTTPVAPPAAVTASPIAPVVDPIVAPLPANARYLVDPVTGERVLAAPVPQPQQPQG
jgi:sec-independent protein translocase protein TatA